MILIGLFLWISVLCLLHSYLFYPLILKWISKNKPNNETVYNRQDVLPHIAFLMSLYNEEKVIIQKLNSLVESNYPADKLTIYIGSDCSQDQTNTLVTAFAAKHSMIRFYAFEHRSGKPSVINQLVRSALANSTVAPEDQVLVISDANVMLEKNTLYQLARHFKNPAIGLVDSNIQSPSKKNRGHEGIAHSETSYISREVYIKHMEGLAWGRTMGPLGGCYALRASMFEAVPLGFLVDDFYIAMKVFEKGGLAINDLGALCYETSPNEIKEEFRRKTRISAGNFANLATFKHLLWPPFSSLSFAFLSHKVLRWYGPFFILISYLCTLILAFVYQSFFYQVLGLLQTILLFGIPLLDWFFQQLNLNVVLLRYITYFNAMNLALFKGFFQYLKGVQNGIWQPTKRDL
jgi:cellulose synthase/poly-beta-1,6-N-acetylglucosamine synthase-like glycosyltransferase